MSAPVNLKLLAQGVQDLPTEPGVEPLWVHLLRVGVVFGFLLIATGLFIWAERRVMGRMQARLGPNRAGPFGVLQSLADGVKLFFKEEIRPRQVDRPVYMLAPLVPPVTALASAAIIPFGGRVTLFGETFDLQIFDPDIGVLWFLAMGSIHVYGVVLGGWASGSAYPLLGGVRSTAQMVSYEVALGLSVGSAFVYAGTLRVSEIVFAQSGPGLVGGVPNWFVIPLFPAFVLFVTALVAETARPPFDLPEAEGELVAGFHTEYSGLKFAMFFLGEFMNVVVGSAIIVTLFFGGPSGPILTDRAAGIWPVVWFLGKVAVFVFVFTWMRATLPRLRYDRLMDFGWRFLLPVGLVWVLATGFMVVVNNELEARARTTVAIGGIAAALLLYLLAPLFSRSLEWATRRPHREERAFKEPERITTSGKGRS